MSLDRTKANAFTEIANLAVEYYLGANAGELLHVSVYFEEGDPEATKFRINLVVENRMGGVKLLVLYGNTKWAKYKANKMRENIVESTRFDRQCDHTDKTEALRHLRNMIRASCEHRDLVEMTAYSAYLAEHIDVRLSDALTTETDGIPVVRAPVPAEQIPMVTQSSPSWHEDW